MSQQKAAKQLAKKLATEAADGVGDLGSGKGAVGGAAGRAAKKAGKKKTVKRLSIFDRNNSEGLFYKSGALKEGARDAVPEAVRSLLQSPDGGPTLGDLNKKELRALYQELVATGNDNLANNLVQGTDAKNWKTSEIKQAENAQPLPDDGSDVLAKGNPDPNDLNNTTGKPRKRNVSDVPVTKPDGTEVKAVDSNTFRKQDRPLPKSEDDLYQLYVSNGIKDVDLKNQLDALFKSPGLQAAYRADRGLDDTASIFSQGRILSDDYKSWILERASDGGVDFFNKAYASGRQTVPRRNAVTPKNRYDKVTTAKEKGVSSASKIAGGDVGAPESSEDFARRALTEENVDPSELPGATPTASGRKQATLPTDAKRQMGVEDLVESLRAEATPEVLRIIADGSDVESSEMAYQVVEAFLNRRIPTGDRVSETAHRAAVQAGADALAASLNRPPYTELHPSILEANNAATRIDLESGKQPVKGQPVETSNADNAVNATAEGSTLGDGAPKKAASNATVTQQPQAEGPGEMFGPPGTKFDPENNVLHKYLAESENGIKDQAAFNRFLADTTDAQKADVVSEAKQAGFVNETPKGPSKKQRQQLDEQNFPGDEDAPPVWEDGSLKQDAKKATKALKDDPDLLDAVPESLKTEQPKGKKSGGKKQTEQSVEEPLEGTTEPSLKDNRKAFTTANLRKYVVEKLVENGMSEADAKKFAKKMDRQQLLEEYEISGGRAAVGRVEQYPGRTPQELEGQSNIPTGIKEFGPSAGPSGKRTPRNTELAPFEVRPTDTGKYPDQPIPTRRDYKKGQSFDNDVENARVDKTVDDIEKWTTRGTITAAGLGALAAWMMSQGMSGDDEASTLSDGISEKGDNPAMELGPDPGGRKGPAAGTGAGGAGGSGMSRLERIRAAQGDRYVAGLAATQPVRGY